MSILKKLFGQGGESDDNGETPEFKAFLEASLEGLKLQTNAHHNTWGLGKSERWNLSQDVGELVFTFPDKIVRAPAQIIGSLNVKAGTWLWAWANASIADSLKRDSIRVQEYGKQHGIRRLTEPKWSGNEQDGWEMAALAGRLCSSNGAYRGPAGENFIFITFGEVHISKRA